MAWSLLRNVALVSRRKGWSLEVACAQLAGRQWRHMTSAADVTRREASGVVELCLNPPKNPSIYNNNNAKENSSTFILPAFETGRTVFLICHLRVENKYLFWYVTFIYRTPLSINLVAYINGKYKEYSKKGSRQTTNVSGALWESGKEIYYKGGEGRGKWKRRRINYKQLNK